MGVYIGNLELKNAYIGELYPESIELNKSSISLTTIGQTVQLTATVEPEDAPRKTVIWSTSDSTVATVSTSGLVTCVTPGECTITATTVNGLTATCSVIQSRLPAEYQEVEWVQSSGSQYIDTGFYPTGTSEIDIDFQWNSDNGIFGVDSGWTRRAFSLFQDRIISYGTQFQNQSSYFTSGIRYHIIFNSSKQCYVNGVLKYTYTAETFTSSISAYIFAKRRNSYVESYSSIKLYSMKLWNNGTLEREFVPCYRIADGVIGLYDLVNDQFYTNLGSGTFTKGSDV